MMKNKKVLWVNPSFLDYRIPLYKELNSICNGRFYLIYSRQRIPARCDEAIKKTLGDNVVSVTENRLFLKRRTDFANSGISLTRPVPGDKRGESRHHYYGRLFSVLTLVNTLCDNPQDSCYHSL